MTTRTFSSTRANPGPRVLAAAIAAAGAVTVAGCESHSTLYHNPQECVAEKIYAPEFCEKEFANAQAQDAHHELSYDQQKDCNSDWNEGDSTGPHACTPTTTGGHVVYVPHMNGYWVGTVGDDNSSSAKSGTASVRPTFSYPAYEAKDGTVIVPKTGQSFSSYGGVYEDPAPTIHTPGSPARPVIVSRGNSAFNGEGAIARAGFGGEGHGFGGGE